MYCTIGALGLDEPRTVGVTAFLCSQNEHEDLAVEGPKVLQVDQPESPAAACTMRATMPATGNDSGGGELCDFSVAI